jgi:tetratricopeptide (TPR) repeat protein
MSRTAALLALALALCGPAHRARAQLRSKTGASEEARQRYEHGLILYDAQRYADANEQFQEAYTLDPRPEYLYALAQSERLGGDCKSAVLAYRAFLRLGPSPRHARLAERQITRCEAAPTTPPAPPAAPPREGAALPVEIEPAPRPPGAVIGQDQPPRREPWYRDWVGDAGVMAGIAAATTGLWLWKNGRDDAEAKSHATTYQQFLEYDGAETREQVGIATAAAGGALLVGGIVHILLHRRATSVEVSVAQGAVWQLSGRF